ncbi:MAG: hypothetical protein K0R26_1957 [Bacteroidota bacterium]|jgi:hypothetical protein|nr:hypothetical protein [Bacteroidota bacterium]
MKTTIIIATFLLSAFSNFCEGQTILKQILTALQSEGNSPGTNPVIVKDVTTQTLIVNSSSNARISGGKTRGVVKVNLPAGTKKWYYRVTVLDAEREYKYQNNETFYYLLNNNKFFETYSPTTEAIDFYILGHSGDRESFLETGNNNFKSFSAYTKIGIGSFIGECNISQENLWIGIKNLNTMVGLKVIVEVVAYGNFN